MAALTGTNVISEKYTEGELQTFVGSYTLDGAIASADTITWSSALPNVEGVTIMEVIVFGDELDTNASPTGTLIVGDGTDADGYLASKTAGGAGDQLLYAGDGALIGTVVTGTDIVLTVGGTLATAASSGTVRIKVLYGCGDFTQ